MTGRKSIDIGKALRAWPVHHAMTEQELADAINAANPGRKKVGQPWASRICNGHFKRRFGNTAAILQYANIMSRGQNLLAEGCRGIVPAGEAPGAADAAHRRALGSMSGGCKTRQTDPGGSVPGSKTEYATPSHPDGHAVIDGALDDVLDGSLEGAKVIARLLREAAALTNQNSRSVT